MFNPTRELLFNPTFWVCLAVFTVLLCQWAILHRTPKSCFRAVTGLRRLLLPVVVLLIGALALLRAGFAVYMAYVAPLDIMQDVVSAQQLTRGQSAYPASGMPSLIVQSLNQEPPRFSLSSLFPALKQKERWETHGFLALQAHPPHLILLALGLWRVFGVHGAAFAVNLLSLAGLCLIVALICSGTIPATRRLPVLAVALFLGWEPVLSLLRQGQSGLLISSLLVLGWFFLRRGSDLAAGAAIGIATCLKLYPGLLLIYLLMRSRRALVSAIATILMVAAIPLPWFGWSLYTEYFHTASRVAAMYGPHPLNLSLLGLFKKNGFPLSSELSLVLSLGAIVAAVLLVRRGRGSNPDRIDAEYSLFCALIPLLSPISWDHYLVVLILPLAVLVKHTLRPGPRWSGVLALALLLLILSIPENFLVFPFASQVRSQLVNVRTASLLSLALCAFAVWMANLRKTLGTTPGE